MKNNKIYSVTEYSFVESMKDFEASELITINQAANLLHVHPETLRRWDSSGELKAIRVKDRGHRRYSLKDIEKLINTIKSQSLPTYAQEQLLSNLEGKYHYEVNSFPTENIPIGVTYTFNKQIAKKVSNWSHGLHIYPAKFIPQIPKWAFDFAKLKKRDVILDPFCGCGTTLVEAIGNGYNAYGIDINPLAQLITNAKTTMLYSNSFFELEEDLDKLTNEIKEIVKNYELNAEDKLNLHPNWEFWFPKKVMTQLLAIKQGIKFHKILNHKSTKIDIVNLRNFYLANLSSIIKKCSYFNEGEIKVRKDKNKHEDNIPNPVTTFYKAVKKNLSGIIELSKDLIKKGKHWSKVIGKNAQTIELAECSVNLIITSPPYLNAIDYAMAHKYSLFILNLVSPDNFKNHCREYIGVTERAVRKIEYSDIQLTNYDFVDNFITKFKDSKSVVDKIRAYIISEYFLDMKKALQEGFRVLKPNSYFIIVVGDNVIRKELVQTSKFIQNIATSKDVGFELVSYFYHQLRNIRLKVNRNNTGGLIKRERVIILKKP